MKLPKDAEKLLSNIKTPDPLAAKNIQEVQLLISETKGHCKFCSYTKEIHIVENGKINDSVIKNISRFKYSFVPLGIILKGEITVLNIGRGVKTLRPGDFIGLFETSDWIINKRSRQIGDWTLIIENDVSILFFDEESLSGHNKEASDFRAYLSSVTRIDKTPKPTSELSLLDTVASHTTDMRLSNCAIIAHTHVLPSSISLFKHLAYLVGTENIFILDKPYSSVRESLNELIKSGVEIMPVIMESSVPYEFSLKKAIDQMWRRVIEEQKRKGFKKIIIIDDGGDIWLSIPWADLEGIQIAGVEQTQRGITRVQGSKAKFPPIVSVASSGIKKNIESDFIGSAIVKKLQDIGIFDNISSVGVIGTGSIGMAVIESLKKIGISALSYDNITHNTPSILDGSRNSIDSLISDSELIIGTTGEDSVRGVVLDRVTGTKIFASASSSDVEFNSLLKLVPYLNNKFQTVSIPVHKDLTIKVLNEGFPINFDRKKEWESADDIVLTRCLLYIGIMQAAKILAGNKFSSGIYTLDQIAQEKTLSLWLKNKEERGVDVIDKYKDIKKMAQSTFLQNSKTIPTVWKNGKSRIFKHNK